MSLRYYPSFRVLTNQSTNGGDFLLNGNPYTGSYYLTYDGKAYAGSDPAFGPNHLLTPVTSYQNAPGLNSLNVPQSIKNKLASNSNIVSSPSNSNITSKVSNAGSFKGAPTPYYPYPVQSDYDRGYLIRYFIKKVNDLGYVIEISPDEYTAYSNGSVGYNISLYQTVSIFWKLTGPLNSVKISQYDTRAGIIDTNKRLVEDANKTFLGIVDFIGGNYSKYSKPTA
jgi:hypothetical protein